MPPTPSESTRPQYMVVVSELAPELSSRITSYNVCYTKLLRFPDFGTPTLVVGIAWLGLQHILQYGGSGYFPMRLVRRYIESDRLHEVRDA